MQENGDFVDADSRYHGHDEELIYSLPSPSHGEASH